MVKMNVSLVRTATTRPTLFGFGVGLGVSPRWIITFVMAVLFAKPLGNGDSEVGEVGVLVLRTGPSRVAAYLSSK